jgi:GGDEF domain-containing protein
MITRRSSQVVNRMLRPSTQALSRVAKIDPLTGLGNAAMFEREVSRSIARYNRYGERFSVLLLSAGQVPQGDPSRVGPLPGMLAKHAREEDSVCHLTGRWFGLVLAGASEEAARNVWLRIQRATEWSPGRRSSR